MITMKSGVSIATTAALLAIAGIGASSPVFAAGGAKAVHCYGVNSCKGTSDCKTAKNECKGLNDCKGQGFKALSSKACAAAGGSLTEPK
ncbi:hypothetical protein BH11PSE5_BH11PSE5_06210 [soil metagenome]|jgi:hypothetical protein|uniref:BufA2 family periplasmic bufferin-type metallophore n=1 Tax=Sphingobium sp. CECT 9361 TaxID=2845384 RepID=UPI001E3A9464|nr:hypothetical protein [Sphingobium sp. CECT 9361]CAH0352134.1 hypothetical protein SPH9361_01860 [Sphingobium sp. CECT 9361]|tara:strand:+ start:2225 stop:2491 length:267 start_codon:yes stop_codon:yes gene_type:complete